MSGSSASPWVPVEKPRALDYIPDQVETIDHKM